MSQGNLEQVTRVGINYEAMPIGKKSVLAPINVMNGPGPLDNNASSFNPGLRQNMENRDENNGGLVMNRKNNRTLKPLKR